MAAETPVDTLPPEERTARLRGACAAARPRITSGQLAERAGYGEVYVRQLLSDNAPTVDVGPALDRIEAALAEILAERRTT